MNLLLSPQRTQTEFLLCIYLVCMLNILSLPSALSITSPTCNCSHVEVCQSIRNLLLNQYAIDEQANILKVYKEMQCDVKRDKCCDQLKENFQNRAIRSAPPRRLSPGFPWVWDRRPFIPVTEENQEDEIENRFASIRDSYYLNNPFQFATNVVDFKDSKTQRNCPKPFYEDCSDISKEPYHHHHHNHHHHDHHHHHNHFDHPPHHSYAFHVAHDDNKHKNKESKDGAFDGPIIYPDDDQLRHPVTLSADAEPKKTTELPSMNTLDVINSPQCGISIGTRILGGTPSSPNQFPWVTRIAYRNKTNERISYRCSGSVIHDIYILTAAHCVINLVQDLELSHIRISDTESVTDCAGDALDIIDCKMASTYDVLDVIVHPDYDQPKYANDIALVKIARQQTGNYATICLPRINSMDLVNRLIGSTGIVAGWSTNKEGVETPANATVKFLRLPIVNNTECAITYAEYSENFNDPIVITPSQLCAQGQPMQDVCRGDSGGPFMDDGTSGIFDSDGRYTLLGVVAFGPTMCGVANFPGVYTRVSSYVQWIVKNIS